MNAPIVEIQPKGLRGPIYCIGAVDGEVIVFRRMALELGLDQPLYGLQPFRLITPLATVERLAAAYIEELLKSGEPEPACLLGYSFGGLVAVEMARQLQRNGVAPPMVLLIDTTYPAGCRAKEAWAQRFQRYRFVWKQSVQGKSASHFVQRVKNGLAQIASRASSKDRISLPTVNDVSSLQLRASEAYRIKFYSGRVHLFRAETQLEFLGGGEDLGWSGVLSDLVIEEVPGDHGTINTGANLKIMAQKVRECLQSPLVRERQRLA